jgi:hypothetical protein
MKLYKHRQHGYFLGIQADVGETSNPCLASECIITNANRGFIIRVFCNFHLDKNKNKAFLQFIESINQSGDHLLSVLGRSLCRMDINYRSA